LKDAAVAPHGYYFPESLVYTTIDVSRSIGEALIERKLITQKDPNAFSQEELDKYFGVCVLLALHEYSSLTYHLM